MHIAQLDNGIEGLIHVTELSDKAFGKVEDIVAKGQEVTAKVLKIDPEHKKIALSIKEYLIDQNQTNQDDIIVVGSSKKPVERGNRLADHFNIDIDVHNANKEGENG